MKTFDLNIAERRQFDIYLPGHRQFDIALRGRKVAGSIIVSAIPLIAKRYRQVSELDPIDVASIDSTIFGELDYVEYLE